MIFLKKYSEWQKQGSRIRKEIENLETGDWVFHLHTDHIKPVVSAWRLSRFADDDPINFHIEEHSVKLINPGGYSDEWPEVEHIFNEWLTGEE